MENPSNDLAETIIHLKTQLTKYITANKQLESLLSDANRSLQEAEHENSLLNNKLKSIQTILSSYDDTLKKVSDLTKTRDQLYERIKELNVVLSSCRKRIFELSNRTQEYEKKNLAFTKALRETDRKFFRSLAVIEHQREILASRDKINKRHNKDIDLLKERLNYTLKQRDVLIAKLRDTSASITPVARET